MVIEVVELRVMEVCATVLAASHNEFRFGKCGEIGVDAVSNSADG
jgi:hypothetical protein